MNPLVNNCLNYKVQISWSQQDNLNSKCEGLVELIFTSCKLGSYFDWNTNMLVFLYIIKSTTCRRKCDIMGMEPFISHCYLHIWHKSKSHLSTDWGTSFFHWPTRLFAASPTTSCFLNEFTVLPTPVSYKNKRKKKEYSQASTFFYRLQ